MAFFPNMGFVVSEFSRVLILNRTIPGQWVNGYWIEGNETVKNIKGAIQPATPKDLQILKEGERRLQLMRIFTLIKLYVTDTLPNQNSDIITDPLDGAQYRLIAASDRSVNGFYRNIAEYLDPNVGS